MVGVSISSTGIGIENIKKAVKRIEKDAVLVGIPAENAYRKENNDKMNNPTLLYIHTNGSPRNNIPPRPVLEPAIEASAEAIGNEMARAMQSLITGKEGDYNTFINAAGQRATNACRAWFEDPRNNWAPNSPSTIYRKGSSRPLIDTGALRKSITYVIGNDRRK